MEYNIIIISMNRRSILLLSLLATLALGEFLTIDYGNGNIGSGENNTVEGKDNKWDGI